MNNHWINNLVNVPYVVLFSLKNYFKQKKFIQKTFQFELLQFRKENDGSLSEKDFIKIQQYYGFIIPFIAEFYSVLRGVRLSENERKTLTYLGGITGLFDDFFDKKHTPENHIKELINHPDIHICNDSFEQLFVILYLKALEFGNAEKIKAYFNDILDVQIASKKQTNSQITSEEIIKITKEKGSTSVLFYRYAIDSGVPDTEKELLMNIGYFAQVLDDIMDVYKDYKEGIHTLATRAESINEIYAIYQSLVAEIYSLMEKSGFSRKNKIKFESLFAIIPSWGFVCLKQLKKLEVNGRFEVANYSRKQLVIDGAKVHNKYKWVQAYLNRKTWF